MHMYYDEKAKERIKESVENERKKLLSEKGIKDKDRLRLISEVWSDYVHNTK